MSNKYSRGQERFWEGHKVAKGKAGTVPCFPRHPKCSERNLGAWGFNMRSPLRGRHQVVCFWTV